MGMEIEVGNQCLTIFFFANDQVITGNEDEDIGYMIRRLQVLTDYISQRNVKKRYETKIQ